MQTHWSRGWAGTGIFRDADASLSFDGELPIMGERCDVPAATVDLLVYALDHTQNLRGVRLRHL